MHGTFDAVWELLGSALSLIACCRALCRHGRPGVGAWVALTFLSEEDLPNVCTVRAKHVLEVCSVCSLHPWGRNHKSSAHLSVLQSADAAAADSQAEEAQALHCASKSP